MDKSGWNMYVFRDGRRSVSGQSLVEALADGLNALTNSDSPELLLNVLLAAGELECALADSGSSDAETAALVTDAVADRLVLSKPLDSANVFARLEGIKPPPNVNVSVQEGFAYYALHPLKFVTTIDKIEMSGRIGVVGIRTIGVVLSAVALAGLRRRGLESSRVTVRPTGHPYNRVLELSPEQQRWARNCEHFLVVDEGPGLSGSSFLAAGEALERTGADIKKVFLVGTREPDPQQLRTENGRERWERFQSLCVDPAPHLPEGADVPIGGGSWRDRLINAGAERPSSWTQLECLKFMSADGKWFLRFEGYGHYGAAAAERGEALASAGFSPRALGNKAGFGVYEFVNGRHLERGDLDDGLMERIARYCSFRAERFATKAEGSELEAMMRFNWRNEFGAELEEEIKLKVVRPAVTDARMSPHEWRLDGNGVALKVDATTDGDGHFFPGPCDIAWDLAGTIVEWQLTEEHTERLLNHYFRASGDDARERVPAYVLAYATLHMAYSRMAARAMGGTAEELLFMRDYDRYRLQALAAQMSIVPPVKLPVVPTKAAGEPEGATTA